MMRRLLSPPKNPQPAGPRLRWFIIAIIVAVAWVPGGVALAMLLTGNAGDG